MIIKGSSRANGGALTAHLGNTVKNERVEVVEVRGTIAQTLRGAFQEMEAVGGGTNCRKPLYHANIDPDARFPMTREQWRESVDALEQKLGLTDQPRVVVMHVKEGREHCHVVWSRIDAVRMRAISDSHNYRKHEEVCRDLERRFGHERVQGAHAEREGKERPARTPHYADIQQQERHGKPGRKAVEAVKQVKADLTALWSQTASGQEFAAALAERGYILVQGDRRDFVVLDSAGAVHSLARRIEGVKTAAVRARMVDVDRASLPTLAAAKARVEAARRDSMHEQPQPDKAAQPEPAAPSPQPQATPDAVRAAHAADGEQLTKRQSDNAALMERQKLARDAFMEGQRAEADKARAEQEQQTKDEAARTANGDITDARRRSGQALADEYRIDDPYSSLARAVMNEYGRFLKQQEDLSQKIEVAKTPEERRTLELRREIEGWEYLAINYQRNASMTRVVTGDMKSEQAQRDETHAKFCMEKAKERRDERAQLIEKERSAAERGDGKEPPREVASARGPEKAPEAGKEPIRATTTPEAAARQRAAEPAEPVRRVGELPKTVAEHEAINRTQEAEKRLREHQAKSEKPARDDSRSVGKTADGPRKETPAEREQRFKKLWASASRESGNATGKDQSRDRGGGGGRDR